MTPEDAFTVLMQSFDVHDHLENPEMTFGDWISFTIKESLSLKTRQGLRRYLDHLLGGSYSEQQLAKMYYATGPTLHCAKGTVGAFLKEIRDKL